MENKKESIEITTRSIISQNLQELINASEKGEIALPDYIDKLENTLSFAKKNLTKIS
jgi:hypothetical protein